MLTATALVVARALVAIVEGLSPEQARAAAQRLRLLEGGEAELDLFESIADDLERHAVQLEAGLRPQWERPCAGG
jgi:hypothetical protein